jgi:hypothetical protein
MVVNGVGGGAWRSVGGAWTIVDNGKFFIHARRFTTSASGFWDKLGSIHALRGSELRSPIRSCSAIKNVVLGLQSAARCSTFVFPSRPHVTTGRWQRNFSSSHMNFRQRKIDRLGIEKNLRGNIQHKKDQKLGTHSEMARKFRLTRFGWQHKAPDRHGSDKRLDNAKQRKSSRRIRFVHRY